MLSLRRLLKDSKIDTVFLSPRSSCGLSSREGDWEHMCPRDKTLSLGHLDSQHESACPGGPSALFKAILSGIGLKELSQSNRLCLKVLQQHCLAKQVILITVRAEIITELIPKWAGPVIF